MKRDFKIFGIIVVFICLAFTIIQCRSLTDITANQREIIYRQGLIIDNFYKLVDEMPSDVFMDVLSETDEFQIIMSNTDIVDSLLYNTK